MVNLPRFRGHPRSHKSAAGVCHGQAQAAGDLAAVREAGSALWEPYFLALLADVYAQEGQVEAGLASRRKEARLDS